MKKSFLIGIPVRDFENPMSRLSNMVSKEERIHLQKHLILNLVNVFTSANAQPYVISGDVKVKAFCDTNKINIFSTKQTGLNNEVVDFLKEIVDFKYWTIVHGDLPYITKHFARTWINLCENNKIVITASKDSGTPIIGGSIQFNKFMYGSNSFDAHTKILNQTKIAYERVFNKEFSFEIDDEEDYLEFIKHKPRWYKKLKLISSPDRI